MLFRKSQRPRRETCQARPEPYHAVSIVPGGRHCRACLHVEGLRFLSGDAPSLPLPACDMACDMACGCVYQHHADRREPSLLSSYFHESTGQPERRQ